MRATRLLVDRPGARLLDIGSGAGKFCIIAAAVANARVSGVEQRGHLVEVASQTAASFGVDVDFRTGTLADCHPRHFDGFYLFNPFAENLCSSTHRLDDTVELSEARFVRDVAGVEYFLRGASVGTRVVTYCGFGGHMPRGYVRVLRERAGGILELWVRTERRTASSAAGPRRIGDAVRDAHIGRASVGNLGESRAMSTRVNPGRIA